MNAQSPIVAGSVAAAIELQHLTGNFRAYEKAFIGVGRELGSDPDEVSDVIAAMEEAAKDLVQLVRTFSKRVDGTLASDHMPPVFDIAERMAEALMEGLTPEAARVLTAAVKREMA